MGQINVRTDEELDEMIEEELEALPYDISRAEVARTALREYLTGNRQRGTA